MTKEDWEKVESALSGLIGHAKLKVDGREVLLERRLVSKSRLSIVTFVDGELKGAWLDPKAEAPESRFMRPVSRYVWTAESRRRLKKESKRSLKRMNIDPNEKRHGYHPFWPSVTAIRRHYQKTFQSIELIDAVG